MGTLNSVEVFGIIAISIMVVSYALEKTSNILIAVFAFGCAMATIYAYLINSYPFMIAEAIWSLIALRRWYCAVKSGRP